jgi:mono/diheme cytochrome c family protein
MLPRTIYLLLLCCWLFIIAIGVLLIFAAFKPAEKKDGPIAICGNVISMDEYRSPNGSAHDGKALFMMNCASCHNPLKESTGPALVGMTKYRAADWMCKFLTDPKFKAKDLHAKELIEKYKVECMKFPHLSCEEVKAILAYVGY